MENPLKIELRAFLGTSIGATLESLGKHLGHMLPKYWILEALGRVLGAHDSQLGSHLEAQRLHNRGRNPKKSMLKNNIFSGSILEGFGPRFGRVFGRFFGPKIRCAACSARRVRSYCILCLH